MFMHVSRKTDRSPGESWREPLSELLIWREKASYCDSGSVLLRWLSASSSW